jgi:cellulose synthase operon protein C
MIKVECVSCKSPYDVDERRIPDKGMKMRCPKCNASFMVARDGSTSAVPTLGAPAAPGADAKKPIAPPLGAAGPSAAKTPLPSAGISLPPPPAAAIAPPMAAGIAAPKPPPSAAAASAFKKTLLGAAPALDAPASQAAPVARIDAGAQAGVSARAKPELGKTDELDLPALKPGPKPAVPWGSLAPPSPESKPAAPRPNHGLPKGAMGVQSVPPLAAAAAAMASSKPSSAGSAFGAVSAKHTMIGHARAKAPELALGEAIPEVAGALEIADLPARKSASNTNTHKAESDAALTDLPVAKPVPPGSFGFAPVPKLAPDAALIDLPAAKVSPPSAAGQAKPFAFAQDMPLVDLPAAKVAAKPAAEVPLLDLPAPKLAKPGAVAPPFAPASAARAPAKSPSDSPLVDLPAPKPTPPKPPLAAKGAKPEQPLVDLPAPKPNLKSTMHGGFADLPAPTGDLDRPGARPVSGPLLDLESPNSKLSALADLPAPKGIVDLPAPKGIADLPTPKGLVDLPTPKGIVDLPTPKGIVDLPTPKGLVDLPGPKGDQGFGELDLPMPKLSAAGRDEASFGDLELPDLPVRAGFGDIELPIPRPGSDVHKPKAPTYQGVGPHGMGDESSFGDLDLAGPSIDRNDEMSFDDIRPDDLLALKSDPRALEPASVPPALRDDGELPETDYGEAGLLDDAEDDMEFGIAGDAEDGFALPPEILRRQRGEAAQAADVARGKRALHVLIGVAIVLGVFGALGAGLGFTDYGYFGVYFLERYLPEAGEPRFTREVIARAEKTALTDTYRDARRALALLGEARHKTGINRELLTRSLLHEALFLVRFGADPNSSAHIAAILSRLEERHGLAPGMDLARAADAARRQSYADAEKFLNSARSEAPRDPYVGLLAGEIALRQGKLAEADKAFAEALKSGGGARAQWGLARVTLARTDEAARRNAVEQTLKLSPLHAEARLADARILWAQGKEERAMHELRQALGQEPIDDQYLWTSKPAKAEGYSLLGYSHEARARLQPARKAYEDALAADPYLVEALLGAGRVLLRERRFSDALARFESGLALAQKAGNATVLSGRRADVEARLGQGRALLALNRAPDAKVSLSALMRDNPNDAEIVLALGQVEDALGNKANAEELLKKAVELAPTTFASYLALSQHYFKLNQPDKASETLNEAAAKVEENVEMRRMLGQSELARNRFESALHEFKRAVELDPQDFDARFGLGVTYRKTGELEKARVLFDEIAARDPQYAGLTLERGQLLEAQGEYTKAVDAYHAAHEKDPSDAAVTLRLGAAQVEASMLDDAAQTLQTVVHETPNSAEAEYFMGRLALARGRGPDALTHFDRALSLDGAQAPYHLYAARAALEMTNLGRTLEESEAALSRDPTLGDAYWVRGIVRMRSGAVKDALKDAKRALELAPGRYDAYALMAECYDELRKLPEAAESYLTALGKDPERGEWWYKLGRLYLDMGSRAQGNDALGKAMALGDKLEPMPYWLPDTYRLSGELARSSNNRRLAVTLFKRYLKIAPDGALDREDVRKLMKSWDIDLSED